MSATTTLTQILTKISYRLGEDSAPSGAEKTRRIQFINEGGKSIIRKHYWWWTETSTTFDSVADQASYSSVDGFPSDIRGTSILELRYSGTLYTPATQTTAFSLTNSDYSGLSQNYFIFNNSLYPVSAFGTSTADAVAVKYYKTWTDLSADGDICIISDDFVDIVVAFALARILNISGKRGSAADAFDEFNEIYKEMSMEQNNYLFALKSSESSETALYE
jgi:hypothetical protein